MALNGGNVNRINQARGYVYNPNTLAWEAMTQPDSSAALTNTQLRATPVAIIRSTVTHVGSNGTAITSATDTTVVAAPSANTHLRIHRLHASNSSSTATWVYWRDGAAGTKLYATYLPQNGVVSIDLYGLWALTGGATPKALVLTTSGAGNVEWTVAYETAAD